MSKKEKEKKFCFECKKELEKGKSVSEHISLQCREKDKWIDELLKELAEARELIAFCGGTISMVNVQKYCLDYFKRYPYKDHPEPKEE